MGNLRKLGQNTENYGFRYKQSIVKSLMSNYASNEVLWLISIQAFKVINLALWLIFQFGHGHWLWSRKICQSKFLDWSKSWKLFQLFQPMKFLSHLNFWINRKIGLIPHEWKWSITKNQLKKNMINQPKYFKKSNLIQVQKAFDSWVILALGHFGH